MTTEKTIMVTIKWCVITKLQFRKYDEGDKELIDKKKGMWLVILNNRKNIINI